MRFLLLVVLIACQGPRTLTIAPMDELALADSTIVAADINKALGCSALWVPGMHGDQHEDFVEVTASHKAVVDTFHDALGYFNPFTGEIFYQPFEGGKDYAAHMRYLVLTHELGHAFGLDHTEGTIMQAALLNMYNTDAIASLVELLAKNHLTPCKE